MTVPGRGTYDLQTGQLLPESTIAGYIPWILIGGLGLILLTQKGGNGGERFDDERELVAGYWHNRCGGRHGGRKQC
jgi:hypothetical protein